MHPDQYTDENTRRLAELQMKRLNVMLTVLADDAARAEYDASLSLIPRPSKQQGPPFWQPRWQIAAAGIATLLVLAAVAVWPRPSDTPKPAVTVQTAPVPSRAAKRPRLVLAPPKSHVSAPEIPVEPPPQAQVSPIPTDPADPSPIFVPVPPVAPEAPVTVIPSPATLSGKWLFTPSESGRQEGYPPEYVELRLAETSGVLHGRYQARYRVPDRAISPNVVFRFEGPATLNGGVFPWQTTGGAKGEVILRLVSDGKLEVDWVAHQLGKELDLISGTATLVRKLE